MTRPLFVLAALAAMCAAASAQSSARSSLLEATQRAQASSVQVVGFLEALSDAGDFVATQADLRWVAHETPRTGSPSEAQLLEWLPTADRVTKSGTQLALSQAQASSFTQNGIQLDLDPEVSLEIERLDAGRVRLSRVKGVRAKLGALGPFRVKTIEVLRDADGARVRAWVAGWPFPVTHTLSSRAQRPRDAEVTAGLSGSIPG